MSADRQALLQALREEPDDERLRFIYADWLEDHGEHDRAERIRLCHELAGLTENDPRAAGLERRRKQLLRRHKKRWWPGLPPAVAREAARRGLLQRLEATAPAFLKCGDALRDEPVARVRLTRAASRLDQVLASPALAGVRELVLADSVLDHDAVRTLADSPRLAQLHTLRLLNCGFRANDAAALAASPHLAGLRTLDLEQYDRREEVNNTVWRTAGATRVITGQNEPGHYNQLGDDGLAALAASPHLAGLESLFVAHNWISPAGARHLWAAGRLKDLRRLDLSFNYLGPQGLGALARSPLMKRLTALEVHGNEVGPEGVRSLAGSRNVRQLRLLDISGSHLYDDRPRLDDVAAEALASSPHLAGLEHLILTYTEIGPKGAEALAKSASLKALRSLYLGKSSVGNRAARAFASSDLIGRLTHLDLSSARISRTGALALVRSKTAGEGLTLDLRDNPLDEGTVAALRERFGGRVLVSGPDGDSAF